MTTSDMTIQEKHLRLLQTELLRPDGAEHAAYILCGLSRIERDPFSGEERIRLLVKDVLPVEPEEITSADERHISWRTDRFVKLLGQAERTGLHVGIAHSHPCGPSKFSSQDDRNEAELVRLAQNRNGAAALVPSMLFSGEGAIIGRVWTSPDRLFDFETVRTVSSAWNIMRPAEAKQTADPALARQALALGSAFNRTMKGLRIGVVGAGGTGSPLIQQLGRMGVGYLAVFDPDTVEESNLNRLYGATHADARDSRRKVDVARREVERMGLGTQVATFDTWIGTPECRDALKSMDLIFGCTDDHDGRALLSRLAYYYLIPVVDLGLALRVSERHGENILEADGRVTVLEPGASCLVCRRIVNPAIAAEEALKRADPEEYERRKSEAYVRGEGNPAPAVVSFTTSVATMAIEEMIQRFQRFRGSSGMIANRVRKFGQVEDFRPGAASEPCRVCANDRIHGVGDVKPFLGRIG
ncbi:MULTISPECIES: ThiF family adenylyltransferase [unclassified Mesorhizobium]|uniref:ThiF family adenylyltransferase n=1 Tax=unclassified Mesorhizobium TaxID=325217 RepID=UPI0003CF27D8|nr:MULTISPECIES: ThiF family adenylyltransferase [unclassified Mesorhizobium]ESX29216.1 thiamine biosynthesis protein ThiF [Mesorhizobium sp. LSHC440B00]ESX37656.1 thiamine biosynthesis protein ThiF [Mesorhizobium sp. LSHC432A00]ESX43030.1 thiamine biosynthesis protein ThiF [Mesorhizobium sp. LSHC440A00]WJI57289.1 ThiF family adenylyltransferase [Mesorhizobium sp. C432A]